MRAGFRVAGWATLVAALAFLTGCAGLYGGAKRKTNADLTLVAFGSVHGELSACG